MLDQAHQEEAPPELASLLQLMASEGSLSSTGVFTIDVRAALPKLEKFQLPKPYFGLLKVVQSAVAANATYIDTDFGSTGITIEHDGYPPQPDELRDLLCYLLSTDVSTGDRSLRDLAIGVNTSLARGASWVEVSARGSDGWSSQRWVSREETSQSQPPQAGGKATVRFVVRRTLGQAASEVLSWGNKDVGGLIHRSRDVMDEDARGIYDRCRNAPIPIRINGRAIPPNLLGSRVVRRWSPFTKVEHRKANVAEICLQTRKESPHLLTAPAESHARYRFLLHGDFRDGQFVSNGRLLRAQPHQLLPHSCFGVIGLRGRSQVPGEVTLVKDGVDLIRWTRHVPKGTSAVLTAEGLRLDLSQFRIVDNGVSQQRTGWLQRLVVERARELLGEFGDLEWSQEEREHLQQLTQTWASDP